MEKVMSFTDLQIKKLKPGNTPYRVWEKENDKGFNIQVTPKGIKTFYLFYKFNGKRRFMPLGTYVPNPPPGFSSLKNARDVLRTAKLLLEQGIDPQVAKEEEKIRKAQELEKAKEDALKEQSIGTIKQLFDYYTDQMRADNKNSWKETKRSLYIPREHEK